MKPTIPKRYFAKTLASAFLFIAANLGATERPNVLFIVCDDLNNQVSTSGYQPIITPAFDQLAAAGMTFNRAYCQYPVCGPSRASFLSGLYPESTGIVDNASDIRDTRPGTLAMPLAFRNAGYWTARAGKLFHTEKINPPECWDDNPDRFTNDEMPLVTKAREAFEAKHGSIQGKNKKAWQERLDTLGPQTANVRTGRPHGPSGLKDEQHRDGKNARKIIEHLENRPYGDKPFFMACGIQKPHIPFLAPDKYFDLYPKEKLQFTSPPQDFWEQAPQSAQLNRYLRYGLEFAVEDPEIRREFMQAYHACITFIDTQIGLIFESLKRTGQWDNTIVVLISDHGFQLGEHFMWGKGTLFEVVNRVPMIVRVPDSVAKGATQPGSKSEGLVELVDLFPTLAELCGLAAPADLQGQSLVPMLSDPSHPGKEVVYTVVCRPSRLRVALEDATLGHALRTERWRYAVWPDGEELYDLANDPMEWKNLARSPEHAAALASLRELMKQSQNRAKQKRQPHS